ncbi:MarC family integral membrane protein [uncultured archaeon]|nr:MarC family integral membrane protein [uncultured archaeon]
MDFDLGLVLKIFFLLNPLASVPILFLAYEQKLDVRAIAFKSALLALVVAMMFIFIGPILFDIYGINTNSFRVAGGIVVLLLGLSMARGGKDYSGTKQDAIVSLIATPLLTGPATMSFLIITAADVGTLVVLANLFVAFLAVAALFLLVAYLMPNINLDYVSFVSRLLGLFLIGLGVEMMAAGVKVLLFAGTGVLPA